MCISQWFNQTELWFHPRRGNWCPDGETWCYRSDPMTNSGLTVINKTDLLPRLSCVSSQRITSLALALSFFCMSRLSTTEKNKHRQNSCCSSAATWLCILLNMKELLEKKKDGSVMWQEHEEHSLKWQCSIITMVLHAGVHLHAGCRCWSAWT